MLLHNAEYWIDFWSAQKTGLHHSTDASYYAWLASELKLVLPDISDRSVLDLGCGSGELYADLGFDRALSYRGVDISEVMLEKFRERFDKVHLALNAAESYVAPEKFGLIFSNAVVQYLDSHQLAQLVSNAAAMLAPRGFMVLTMIPWVVLRHTYRAGDMVDPQVSALARMIRSLKGVLRDRMGYWYSWNDIRRLARTHGLDPFFHGSLADPYRFHVVLTRIKDFADAPDPLMTRLLVSRRS